MISKPWRDRLTYLAMSLFICWHATAIVIGPAPVGSPPVETLRSIFRPYLTLFRLESPWSFFTNVTIRLPQFRYVVKDADGKEHIFVPIDEFSWYHPRYNWFERIYWSILDSTKPQSFGNRLAASLCRQHAELKPVSITFLAATGEQYWPEDVLRGHQHLDPEFVTVETLMSADCAK